MFSTTAGRELEHVVEYPFGVGKDCEPAVKGLEVEDGYWNIQAYSRE